MMFYKFDTFGNSCGIVSFTDVDIHQEDSERPYVLLSEFGMFSDRILFQFNDYMRKVGDDDSIYFDRPNPDLNKSVRLAIKWLFKKAHK